jgi:hypothetical protein
MPHALPLTQFNLLRYVGTYPEINETVTITDYGGELDICVEIHTIREFNIERQNYAEFWRTMRFEFWPELDD